ncbi:hypothetical protein BCO71033_03798 [Burkholderia contaminans]|uniref:Uncharacterized protein n=1 Tax=Burkholderia contaminans TaxID=488447 RepID=A0A6P2ZDX3_9BURK|nr:hypothetical protein BCO71033_03798 [Burkholderia contaminans]
MGGARERPSRARALPAVRHGRVRRHHLLRPRDPGVQCVDAVEQLRRHGQCAEHGRGPAVVRARPHRPEHGDRYRLLVVAGVPAPGLRKPALTRNRHGARGRRQSDAVARGHGQFLAGAHAVAGRPLQDLRRGGGRLRARRRVRHGGAQAPRRRARRRRPRARHRARHGGRPGRRGRRADRAEPRFAGAGDPPRIEPGRPRARRRFLCRGPRYRDVPRRPDRGRSAGRRLRRRARGERAARDRFGQDQYRASGVGVRHRRPDQGPAVVRARPDSGAPAFHPTQSAYAVAGHPDSRRRRSGRVAARGTQAHRRGERVRIQRHQCPRDRRGTARRAGARRAARAAAAVGPIRSGAGGARATLRAHDRRRDAAGAGRHLPRRRHRTESLSVSRGLCIGREGSVGGSGAHGQGVARGLRVRCAGHRRRTRAPRVGTAVPRRVRALRSAAGGSRDRRGPLRDPVRVGGTVEGMGHPPGRRVGPWHRRICRGLHGGRRERGRRTTPRGRPFGCRSVARRASGHLACTAVGPPDFRLSRHGSDR